MFVCYFLSRIIPLYSRVITDVCLCFQGERGNPGPEGLAGVTGSPGTEGPVGDTGSPGPIGENVRNTTN